MKTNQVHMVKRPKHISISDFVIAEVELPPLQEGQVLVENEYMSIEPYFRRSMDADGKDLDPWPIGAALDGPSIGRVIDSKNSNYVIGDIVESMSGFQQHFVSNAEDYIPYESANDALIKRRVGNGTKAADYMSLLGIAAQTGYFAVMNAIQLVAGETLVVSSGAGSIGTLVCQIAKMQGVRVVASAGSDAKVDMLLNELGVDYAFNYKKIPFEEGLKAGCPNGIDQVIENASPEHLSACLPLMNFQKHILIIGMVGIYDSGGVVENIKNFEYVLDSFLTIKGHLFMDYLDAYDQFVIDMTGWRNEGKLKQNIHQFDGLESAPEALLSLFNGSNTGKVIVKL